MVGGAVASIYTNGRYISNDLDFVTVRKRSQIEPVMKKFGFYREGKEWSHPDTDLSIDFVESPAIIGERVVKTISKLNTSEGEVAILSPLDSACDRLAWFLLGDVRSMEQCADIIVEQNVAIEDVETWLATERFTKEEKSKALAIDQTCPTASTPAIALGFTSKLEFFGASL